MFRFLVYIFIASQCSELAHSLQLIFEPDQIGHPITEMKSEIINVSINQTLTDSDVIYLKVMMEANRITRASVDITYFNLSLDNPSENLTVRGEFLGHTRLEFYMCVAANVSSVATNCTDSDWQRLNESYPIVVMRQHRFVDTVFTISILCLVVIANLTMGCTVDIQVVKEVLKRPTAPVIGFFCQFTIMPPVRITRQLYHQYNVPGH